MDRELVREGCINVLFALQAHGETVIRAYLEQARSNLLLAHELKAAHAVAEVLIGRRFAGELKAYVNELSTRYGLELSAD